MARQLFFVILEWDHHQTRNSYSCSRSIELVVFIERDERNSRCGVEAFGRFSGQRRM